MTGLRQLRVPLILVTLIQMGWATPSIGVAHLHFPEFRARASGGVTRTSIPAATVTHAATRLPLPASFRIVRERGLLVDAWINGAGPYTLAIDTGAGSTILSERLAATAGVLIQPGRPISLSGLSGRGQRGSHEGVVQTLALGKAENLLPANRRVIVSNSLPSDIDGILDPTEAYSPFGYVIDIPNHEIGAFDCALHPLSMKIPPADGAVVHWITAGGSRRPFVRLDDGRLALLDTGSAFGLTVTKASMGNGGHDGRREVDMGGGAVSSKRIEPSTVSVGSLTLRGVPTDVLSGIEKGAPTLLGRDALSPFRLVFDPLHRLIAIAPAER